MLSSKTEWMCEVGKLWWIKMLKKIVNHLWDYTITLLFHGSFSPNNVVNVLSLVCLWRRSMCMDFMMMCKVVLRCAKHWDRKLILNYYSWMKNDFPHSLYTNSHFLWCMWVDNWFSSLLFYKESIFLIVVVQSL